MDGEVLVKKIRRRRLARTVMYALLAAAGICALVFPSDLVKEQVGPNVVLCWSASMFFGAMLCFLGSVTRNWLGEFSGLPLLIVVIFLYGISAMLGAGWQLSALFAYGLVVLGFSAGLIARWQDVRDDKRECSDGDRGEC